MNIFNKIYCRVYQWIFKIATPLLPYRKPETLESVLDIKNILKMNYLKSALIVTDKGIRNLGLVDSLEFDLKDNLITPTIFDNIVPNPTVQNIEDGVKTYTENNCDCIIAFGGGSVMDCAKMIGARVSNPKKTVSKMKGLLKVKNKLPMLIAIPTTATKARVIQSHLRLFLF